MRENEVSATCTREGGYDSVTYCINCGIEMSREHIALEKLPHTEQIVPGTPADCSHTGLTEGKICSVCGEVLVEQQVIPEAHEYDEPVWSWADDYSAATATFVCNICGKEASFDAYVTESYAEGKMVYSATVTVLNKTYSDTVTVNYTMTYSYIDANGEEKTTAAEPLTSDMIALESGWYAVDSDLSFSERIDCSGDVHLILCDGSTLTARRGVGVNRYGSITIYGQRGGTGALTIDSTDWKNAGIGGQDCVVTINGGTISAKGGYGAAGIGGDEYRSGTVIINGGTVNAEGGRYGSGIGGGSYRSGTVTINGGTISVKAGDYVTGIGSGYDCSNGDTVVTINDGVVEVSGEYYGCCIGGYSQKRVEVIINGGSVTTSSTGTGIGIGCRQAPEPNASAGPLTVTINGGQVTARADQMSYGIGNTDNNNSFINLGWNSITDSITVDGYMGTVTLTKPFTDGTSSYEIGAVNDVDTIRGKTLTPYAPTSWAELQTQIDSAESSSTISLYLDYAATNSDTALTIPAGKEIILDLNGHTLDRNLSVAAKDGRVIVNNGILTIKDSSTAQTGTVTGGYYNGDGGAILNNKTRTLNIEGGKFTGNAGNHGGVVYNMGTMNMTGGSMYGNTANGNGGAVWNGRQGVLNLSGGVITDNTYGEGGAVYSRQDGTLNIFGSPVVTENGNRNIYLRQAIINVTGALNSDAKLAVTCEDATDGFVFTSGLSGNGTAENFVSDQSGYNVCLNDDGEAVLKRVYTITLDTIENGSVEASAATAYEGDTITLTVTPDEGYSVTGVTVNGAEITPKDGVYSFVMPNEDVTVSAAFGFADEIGARLLGHSLSLDGDIGVNFYMELSDSIANSDTAYMHFTIPAGDITTQTDVKVADADKVELGGKTYYVFKCQVAAKEMTSEIKAQIIDGTREGTIYTYSVKEYADYLLAHTADNAEYAKAAPLVKAMLNYGAYSQLNFDKNPGALANSGLTDAEKELGDISIDIADPVINNLPEGTTFEGASLSLKSETTLSLFFKSSETLTFSCDGYNVETVQSGGYQVARIRGIKAKHIGDILTLHVNCGTVQYSPLNYCKNVLNSSDSTPDEAQAQDGKLVNVVKALYLYWQAADSYFD